MSMYTHGCFSELTGTRLCRVEVPSDKARANLRLIAAAPELYAALDHIRKHLRRASDGRAADLDALVDMARAAIAKAEAA